MTTWIEIQILRLHRLNASNPSRTHKLDVTLRARITCQWFCLFTAMIYLMYAKMFDSDQPITRSQMPERAGTISNVWGARQVPRLRLQAS